MLGVFKSFSGYQKGLTDIWPPAPTPNHMSPVVWFPGEVALQLCAQPSAAFPHLPEDAWLGTPGLTQGLCCVLCLSHLCHLFLLLELFTNGSYAAAPLKERPARAGNGNNASNTSGIYNTSPCVWCVFTSMTSLVFMVSL